MCCSVLRWLQCFGFRLSLVLQCVAVRCSGWGMLQSVGSLGSAFVAACLFLHTCVAECVLQCASVCGMSM